MSRRYYVWQNRSGGHVETTNPSGFDVLINGTDKYLNFKTLTGITGYGFRDNNGVIEVKNEGGAWTPIPLTSGSVTHYAETPNEAIDGARTVFTVDNTITFVIGIYMNGQFIHPADYSYTGNEITFGTAPDISYAGLPFTVVYF